MTNPLTEYLLTQTIIYGAPLFGLNLLLGAIGLPIGASFMLIAAGAFSQQGYFSWVEMSCFGLAGALTGDALSFGMGRYGGKRVEDRLSRSGVWMKANASFNRSAWAAIFLTRFLITALAIPINLIAGASGYRFSRFMLYDFMGEITWFVLYGGLGFLFGSRWEEIGSIVSDFGFFLLGAVILSAGIWLARRRGLARQAAKTAAYGSLRGR
jgi:membrane protein DedA with SNARE-associated domain